MEYNANQINAKIDTVGEKLEALELALQRLRDSLRNTKVVPVADAKKISNKLGELYEAFDDCSKLILQIKN